MHEHDDFDFEHSPGIPAPLPPGEHIQWQGRPDFRTIALNAFHVRKIAAYFALLLLIQGVSVFQTDAGSLLATMSLTLFLSVVGLGILLLLAYLTSRVTIYTVTNKRILIRFGIALQMTINLPFSQIHAADMRIGNKGFGDIPLRLKNGKRVSYMVLWPNVRPWNFSRPEPMLRGIANVQSVAKIIASTAKQHSAESIDASVCIGEPTPHTAPYSGRLSGAGATRKNFAMESEVS